MFRNVDWAEYGGSVAMAAGGEYLEAAVANAVPSIASLPGGVGVWVDAAVVASDLFFSHKLHGTMGSALDGAAVYAAGDLGARLLKLTGVLPGTTSPTTGTSASVDYVMAPAVSAPSAYGQTSAAVEFDGFHGE